MCVSAKLAIANRHSSTRGANTYRCFVTPHPLWRLYACGGVLAPDLGANADTRHRKDVISNVMADVIRTSVCLWKWTAREGAHFYVAYIGVIKPVLPMQSSTTPSVFHLFPRGS